MLKGDPFTLKLAQAYLVGDPKCLGRILAGPALGMHRIEDVLDVMLGVVHLARQNTFVGGASIVFPVLRRRKLVTAIRTHRVGRMDDRPTLGTFLGRRPAATVAGALRNLDRIDRAVT